MHESVDQIEAELLRNGIIDQNQWCLSILVQQKKHFSYSAMYKKGQASNFNKFARQVCDFLNLTLVGSTSD